MNKKAIVIVVALIFAVGGVLFFSSNSNTSSSENLTGSFRQIGRTPSIQSTKTPTKRKATTIKPIEETTRAINNQTTTPSRQNNDESTDNQTEQKTIESVSTTLAPDEYDPQNDTMSGAVAIPFSPSAFGSYTLSTNDKNDWYKIDLYENATYRFIASNKDDNSILKLDIIEAATNENIATTTASNNTLNADLTFQAKNHGQHYVQVTCESENCSYEMFTHIKSFPHIYDKDAWDTKDNIISHSTNISTEDSSQKHVILNTFEDKIDWFKPFFDPNTSYTLRLIPRQDSLLSVKLYKTSNTKVVEKTGSSPGKELTIKYTYDSLSNIPHFLSVECLTNQCEYSIELNK